MADQDQDPVSLDDSDSSLRPDGHTRRLCIVSRTPLLCSPFIAALRKALTPYDKLEIVVDRRREGVPTGARLEAAKHPSGDRRQHPQIERQLKMDGFGILPAPTAGFRTRPSAFALLPDVPFEEVWPEDQRDEERLESVRNFRRTGMARLTMRLVLALLGLISAVVIVFAPSPSVRTLVSRLRPQETSLERLPALASPPQDKGISLEADILSVTAHPATIQRPELSEAPSPVRAEHSPSDVGREFGTTRGSSGTSATARVTPNARTTTPRKPIANVAIARNPPSDAVATLMASPRFPGLPRVEVVGSAAPAWRQGETYALRIFDAPGRPLDGANVLLLAHMADGTVRSILLHSGTEPGTYEATLPGGSAPVDLRIGITTSDTRVEIPLSP